MPARWLRVTATVLLAGTARGSCVDSYGTEECELYIMRSARDGLDNPCETYFCAGDDCSHSGYCDYTCGNLGYIPGCEHANATSTMGSTAGGSLGSSSKSSDDGLHAAGVAGVVGALGGLLGLGAAGPRVWRLSSCMVTHCTAPAARCRF